VIRGVIYYSTGFRQHALLLLLLLLDDFIMCVADIIIYLYLKNEMFLI